MSGNSNWNERLKALEALLAELYPTVPDSRRIVAKAELPVALIRFNDTAAVNWFNILETARNHGRVDDIVRAALSDFPEHAGLIALEGPETALPQNVQNPPPASSVQEDREIKAEPSRAPDESRSARSAARDDERHDSVSAKKHLVVLVHGIRTRSHWYIEVRDLLLAEGFEVALTNYGRFDLFRFLLPLPFIKAWAAADVERDIRAALVHHQATEISVIAHSFGTYVTAWILKRRFDIKFRHIIFCGSVVKFRFPFEQLSGRFSSVLNEVGTRDIWPILAVNATWGYGTAGAFGFHRPPVHDRYHRGLSHSAFLNAQFCETWWIPVLRGERPKKADLPEKPPLWLQFLSVVHVKYIVVALLAFWGASTWCRAPEREVLIPPDQVVFVGHKIDDLVAQAEQPCAGWCPEFLKCQRCMRSTSVDSATRQLVLCRPPTVNFWYRDPAAALERLRGAISCVQVEGVSERRLKVQLNKNLASELKAADGRSLWLCGCDEEGKRKVLEIVNR